MRYIVILLLFISVNSFAQLDPISAKRLKKDAEEWAKNNKTLVRGKIDQRIFELRRLTANGVPVYNLTCNLNAAKVIKLDEVRGKDEYKGVEGETMTVGVWDGGTIYAHDELENRLDIRDLGESENHATHVGGTIAAVGLDANASGMAPKANLYSWDWSNDMEEMELAAQEGLLVSNHSYGDGAGFQFGSFYDNKMGFYWFGNESINEEFDYKYGFYNEKSAEFDRICHDNPNYTVVIAAGNDRNSNYDGTDGHYYYKDGSWIWSDKKRHMNGPYDCLSGHANSKNTIVVAAVSDKSVMSEFSNWGPTDDGRIKPDISANGVQVYSTVEGGYAKYDGTSMAAPSVTGAIALLQEYHNEIHSYYMTSAGVKALMINSATDEKIGPDYSYGWGILNVKNAADHIKNSKIFNVSIKNEFTAAIKPTGGPVKLTIAWTDLAGAVGQPAYNDRTSRLVNDLDVRLKRGEDVYMPFILDPENPELPAATGDNFRDNVEQIYIESPGNEEFELVLSSKNQLDDYQNCAIVISGAELSTFLPDYSVNIQDIENLDNQTEFAFVDVLNKGFLSGDKVNLKLFISPYEEFDVNAIQIYDEMIQVDQALATMECPIEIPNDFAYEGFMYVYAIIDQNNEVDELNDNNIIAKEEVWAKIDIVNGIEKNSLKDANQISLFPNPSPGEFSIKIPGGVQSEIIIYKLTGQKVYQGEYAQDLVKLNLPIDRGIYMVKINTDQYSITKKLIIHY